MTTFFERIDYDIPHQFAHFSVSHVNYIMDFSSDPDVINGIVEFDSTIGEMLEDRFVCNVKFAVAEYYDDENADLYAPPKDHHFGKAEITLLKKQLENLLIQHYQYFKPECYFFVAERPSLTRMYQKMCDNRSLSMVEFSPITQLGEEHNCFIIKTPMWSN